MKTRLRHRVKTGITISLAAFLAAGALAACGGSSSTKTTTTTQQARLTPNSSNPDVGPNVQSTPSGGSGGAAKAANGSTETSATTAHGTRAPRARHAAATTTGRSTHQGIQKARPGPDETDENNPTLGRVPDPCRLVSTAQARSILKASAVGQVEAPLGPTCIYQPRSGKTFDITLSVQSVPFAQATQHLAHRQNVALQGHEGVCGKLGVQMLYVSLPSEQVLNVTAPCGVAKQFASIALGRLGA